MKTKKPKPLQPDDITQYEHVEAIEYLLGEMRVHLSLMAHSGKSDKYDDAINKMDACITSVLKCGDFNTGRIRLDIPDFVKFARQGINARNKEFGESIKASGAKPVASVSFDIHSGKVTTTECDTPPKVSRKRLTLGGLWDKFCQLR